MSSKEIISNSEYHGETGQSNNKEKEIYFIITTQQDKNINNLKFKSKIISHKVYNKNIEISNGKEVLYHNVFKIVIKHFENEKYENDYVLAFINGCDS